MAEMLAGVLLHCYGLSMPTALWSPDAHSQAWHLCQGCFVLGLGSCHENGLPSLLRAEKENATA
eukprot:7031187-Ditylum_brightwellii.AAC.1